MKCPHCGSSRTIKAGKKKNKYIIKQGYRCKDFRRYFVERDGFEEHPMPASAEVYLLGIRSAGWAFWVHPHHLLGFSPHLPRPVKLAGKDYLKAFTELKNKVTELSRELL